MVYNEKTLFLVLELARETIYTWVLVAAGT
jgi:hypothetical protein